VAAEVELWVSEQQWMTEKLAVWLVVPEEDKAWWLMVTHAEEDGGVVNGGSRRCWPVTQARNWCCLTRG
jgi:hypothetical protein